MRAEIIENFFHTIRDLTGLQKLCVTLDLERTFTKDELTSAALRTIAAHPVLGCRFVPGTWGDRWEEDPDCGGGEPVVVEPLGGPLDEATLAYVREDFDPAAGWPWRVKLLTHENGARLLLKMSHMVADAAGVLTATREFGACLMDPARRPPLNTAGRSYYQFLHAVRPRRLPRLIWDILDTAALPLKTLLIRRAAESVRRGVNHGAREVYQQVTIGGEQYRQLKERCQRLRCTLNDALVAALAEVAKEKCRGYFTSVAYTVNLRRYLPAAPEVVSNLSGVGIVLLKSRSVGGFDQTIRLVNARIGEQKKNFAGLPFILANMLLYMLLPFPLLKPVGRWIVRRMVGQLSKSTFVTNFGPLDDYLKPFGELVCAASVIGPFPRGYTFPLAVATGFRDCLTLQFCSYEGGPAGAVEKFAQLTASRFCA